MDTITNEVPTTLGAAFRGGFYTGRILVGAAAFAIVTAPKADGEIDPSKWANKVKRVAGALSFNDGRANTLAMAEAGSKLAEQVLALRAGGFDDWYLPSRDEVELQYRAFKPTTDKNWCWRGDNPSSVPPGWAYMPDDPAQTAIEEFRKGGAEAFAPDYYWTSTQYAGYDDFAWIQIFGGGGQYGDHKVTRSRARAVRREPI